MNILYVFPNAKGRAEYEKETKKGLVEGRYSLYGMDYAIAQGEHSILDSLFYEAEFESHTIGKYIDLFCNKIITTVGGVGGSFYKVFRMRHFIHRSDRIVTTADRVGIPLIILMSLRLVPKREIIYISIGLPEVFEKMSSVFSWLFLKMSLHVVAEIICYGHEEYLLLQKRFSQTSIRVHFIPFGVDTDAFTPQNISEECKDVVCVGADIHRDFLTLFKLAQQRQEISFSVITSSSRQKEWEKNGITIPKNVQVALDVPFNEMKRVLSQAMCVILPVRNNSYSGATTTLLQTMALEKAVIVSRVGAIKNGYHLEHEKNVFFVSPENLSELKTALSRLLNDHALRARLGKNARETVVKHHTWRQYAHMMYCVITKERE